MQRDAAFRYTCNRCKKCCHNKVIPLNPYEVVRLARNRGVSTGAFIEESTLDGEGSVLLFHPPTEGGACKFLGPEGCTVHGDRPLACRLYPLGRWTAGPGIEAFARVEPEPGSLGVYGDDGTIADFLKGQGVERFFEAADGYLALYSELADVAELLATTGEIPKLPGGNWLDVDAVVSAHCGEHGLDIPVDPDDVAKLHIEILKGWIREMSGQAS